MKKAQKTAVRICQRRVKQGGQSETLTHAHQIQDTIHDGFRIRGDNITTLANTPGNRVDKPHKHEPAAADVVSSEDIGTEGTSICTTFKEDGEGNEEESNAGEGEEAYYPGQSLRQS